MGVVADNPLPLSSIYSTSYDAFVLASLTYDSARFRIMDPDAFLLKHLDYPSKYSRDDEFRRSSAGESRVNLEADEIQRRMSAPPPRLSAQLQLRKLSRRISRMPRDDALNATVPLCFPDGANVHRIRPECSSHSLVMTNMCGERTYAVCATYYRPCYAMEASSDDDCSFVLRSADSDYSEDDDCLKVYAPTCIMLISSHPYFCVLKDAASCLLAELQDNDSDFDEILKLGTIQLTCTPVPPPGKVDLTFKFFDMQLILQAADYPSAPLCDLDMSLLFVSLSIEDILLVISALLTQKKIVFLSSNHALPTMVMETLLRMIEPFEWRYTYIPVLGASQIDILDAPTIYLLGVHSRYRDCVLRVDGAVLVDLDAREVTTLDGVTLPELPRAPCGLFLQHCRNVQIHFQLASLEHPTAVKLEQLRLRELKFRRRFSHYILAGCVELMVNLFRDALVYVKGDKWIFDKEGFLTSQSEHDYLFYNEAVNTDAFKEFIKSRLQRRRDPFFYVLSRTRTPTIDPCLSGSLEPSSQHGSDIIASPRRHITRFSSFAITVGPPEEHTIIALPPYIGEGHFYTRCIKLLDTYHEQFAAHPPIKASLHYVSGCIQLACKNSYTALENFSKLNATDNRIFPNKLVQEILESADERVLTKVEKLGLLSAAEWSNLMKRRAGRIDSIEEEPEARVETDIKLIPTKPVDLEEFAERIEMLGIAADRDTIKRLFAALTGGDSEELLPASTFEGLYTAWVAVQVSSEEWTNAVPPGVLEPGEMVLKASGLISTSRGSGQLLLTQKRLLLHQEGSAVCSEIMRLRDIESIKKIELSSFLTSIDALEFVSIHTESEVFVARLREERNCWQLLAREMWSGKRYAQLSRDLFVTQQAALNVLLMDATVRLSQDESFLLQDVEFAANQLSYFHSRMQDSTVADCVSEHTEHRLQHRINPNYRERDSRSIDALLYTPGQRSGQGSCEPRLWVGLGSGKIKVYDASTWVLEHGCITLKSRPMCLLSVGGQYVWAGSYDNNIYVIDIELKACNIVLSGHSDTVMDLAVGQDETRVFSASFNGQIICWDTTSLDRRFEIQIPELESLRKIQCVNGVIWCCTTSAVLAVDTTARQITTSVTLPKHLINSPLDTFLITEQNQLWLGSSRPGVLTVWTIDNEAEPSSQLKHLAKFCIKCRGINKLLCVNKKVWAGSKAGMLYIFDVDGMPKFNTSLPAHSDALRSMCPAQNRYIITGSSTADGKVAIWRA